MNPTLVIGSRGSQLALWQANYIARRLAERGVQTRIEIIKTTGDHLQTASLTQAGGKGLFTKEIEEALLAGSIDLAVHSLKDLPTENPARLTVAAIPEREDPRDAIVGKPLSELQPGARVGTSSNRRASQLRTLLPGLVIEPVRGNVDTRLRKLQEGQFDAILLAAAGLRRLGLESHIAQLLEPAEMCPAPGQGALAVQTRMSDRAFDLCRVLNDAPTAAAVTCERAVLSALGGGCQLPIGAFANAKGDGLQVLGGVFGDRALRASAEGAIGDAEALGRAVAEALISQGAHSLLAPRSEE